MAGHERIRLSLPGSCLRHRGHQRALRARQPAGGPAGRHRPSAHGRLSGAGRGHRGGHPQARDTPAIDGRLWGRTGRRTDAEAHQCALGDGWPGGRAPNRPETGAAAQRLRGSGAVVADHSRDLGTAHRHAEVRGRGPPSDFGAGHRARRRRAGRGGWTLYRGVIGGVPYRFRADLGRRNMRYGRISNARTDASPARASFPARDWPGFIARG